jgi:hypothetical protein
MNPLRVIYLATIVVPLLVRLLVGTSGGSSGQSTLYERLLGYADPILLLALLTIALGFAVAVSVLERRATNNPYASRTDVILLALAGAAAAVTLGAVSWLSVEVVTSVPVEGYGNVPISPYRRGTGMSNVALLAVVLGIVDTLLASFRVRAAAFQRRVQKASAPEQEPGSSPVPDDVGDQA